MLIKTLLIIHNRLSRFGFMWHKTHWNEKYQLLSTQSQKARPTVPHNFDEYIIPQPLTLFQRIHQITQGRDVKAKVSDMTKFHWPPQLSSRARNNYEIEDKSMLLKSNLRFCKDMEWFRFHEFEYGMFQLKSNFVNIGKEAKTQTLCRQSSSHGFRVKHSAGWTTTYTCCTLYTSDNSCRIVIVHCKVFVQISTTEVRFIPVMKSSPIENWAKLSAGPAQTKTTVHCSPSL